MNVKFYINLIFLKMRKYRILNLYYLTKLIKIIFFKSLYFINILNFNINKYKNFKNNKLFFIFV